MKLANIILIAFQVFSLHAVGATAMGQDLKAESPKPLPFPKNFDPSRYLGRWYEVARLPTRIQPPETLAIAEYSAGDAADEVSVKNSAFDKTGKKLSEIQGKAKLAAGDPPGRLMVSFGPVFPETPNYHVLHVDEDYTHAVVGVPDRQSLWILARKVPILKDDFNRLRQIAQKAGFDATKLVVAPWEHISAIPGSEAERGDPSPDKAR